MSQTAITPMPADLSRVRQYTGEVVYLYAFDVAYELARQPIGQLLGQPVAQFVVDASKRSPRHLFFYRPQMVRLAAAGAARAAGAGAGRARGQAAADRGDQHHGARAVRGAIRWRNWSGFTICRFSNGSWLYDEVRSLAEDVAPRAEALPDSAGARR